MITSEFALREDEKWTGYSAQKNFSFSITDLKELLDILNTLFDLV